MQVNVCVALSYDQASGKVLTRSHTPPTDGPECSFDPIITRNPPSELPDPSLNKGKNILGHTFGDVHKNGVAPVVRNPFRKNGLTETP